MMTGHYGLHQRNVDLVSGLRARDDDYETSLCVVTTPEIFYPAWSDGEIQ